MQHDPRYNKAGRIVLYQSGGSLTFVSFLGIGWAVVLIAFYTDFFYNVVIAWSIHFLFSSFTSELPWATCGHEWNTEYCYEGKASVAAVSGNDSNATLEGTTVSNVLINLTLEMNSTNSTNVTEEVRKISPAEEYFKYCYITFQSINHFRLIDLINCITSRSSMFHSFTKTSSWLC